MLAGTQGGKTSFGPWWLYREIYGMGDRPGLGAGDYLAVTTSFDLFKLKMLPEIRTVFEEVMQVGRYWAGDRIIELRDPRSGKFSDESHRMWGRIMLRSANSPSGLEAATAKAAWLDEVGQDEWDVTVFESILRRLSLYQGRVLGTSTVYNSGWLKSEWFDRWVNGDRTYSVVQFESVMNPMFPMEEFMRAKNTMPTWRFEMFYRGNFARPAGLIYDCLTDEMIVEPFEIPTEWPGIVGVDFGGANTATIWLAYDERNDVWYAHHESLEGNMSSAEHAEKMLAKAGKRISFLTFCGGALSETQSRMDFGAGGVNVYKPLVSDVEGGISRVIGLIKMDKFRVFRSMAGLRHEFATYRRKLADDGQPSDDIMLKSTFHRLDALRYAVTRIDVETGESMLDMGRIEGYKSLFR